MRIVKNFIPALLLVNSFAGLGDEYRARTQSGYTRKQSTAKNVLDVTLGLGTAFVCTKLAQKFANVDALWVFNVFSTGAIAAVEVFN